MELDPEEQKRGYTWFWGAGTAALALSFFLFWADQHLSNSNHEAVVSETLYELRTAQTTVPSRSSDVRSTTTFLVGETNAEGGADGAGGVSNLRGDPHTH